MNKLDEGVIQEKLRELRLIILENKLEVRMDDAYLLRFLNEYTLEKVQNAYSWLKRYEEFKTLYANTWLNINMNHIRALVSDNVVNLLDGHDKNGRRIFIIRPCLWNTSSFTGEDLLKVSCLDTEVAQMKEQNRMKGLVAIYDLRDIGIKQLNALTPRFTKKMVYFLTVCLPARIEEIYIIRQPKLFSIIFACFKPFLTDTVRKTISICGDDLSLLYERLGSNVLPKYLGGLAGESDQLKLMEFLETEEIKADLEKSGYFFT